MSVKFTPDKLINNPTNQKSRRVVIWGFITVNQTYKVFPRTCYKMFDLSGIRSQENTFLAKQARGKGQEAIRFYIFCLLPLRFEESEFIGGGIELRSIIIQFPRFIYGVNLSHERLVPLASRALLSNCYLFYSKHLVNIS